MTVFVVRNPLCSLVVLLGIYNAVCIFIVRILFFVIFYIIFVLVVVIGLPLTVFTYL